MKGELVYLSLSPEKENHFPLRMQNQFYPETDLDFKFVLQQSLRKLKPRKKIFKKKSEGGDALEYQWKQIQTSLE